MWKKLASMIAGTILVSSCQTSMYKPIICEQGTALKNGRCQKVPPIQNRTDLTAPAPKKKAVVKKSAPASSLLDQRAKQRAPEPFLGRPSGY